MNDLPTTGKGWQARLRKTSLRLMYWSLAWVFTMAIATFGPMHVWTGEPLTVLAIAANLAVGIGMIIANKDNLLSMDELQQKIHLSAMGVTVGVGLVFGLAYSNLDHADIISGHAEISHVVLLMGVTYLATVGLLLRKYQ